MSNQTYLRYLQWKNLHTRKLTLNLKSKGQSPEEGTPNQGLIHLKLPNQKWYQTHHKLSPHNLNGENRSISRLKNKPEELNKQLEFESVDGGDSEPSKENPTQEKAPRQLSPGRR